MPTGRGNDGLALSKSQKQKQVETRNEHFDLLKKSRALSRTPILPVTVANKSEAPASGPVTVSDSHKTQKWTNENNRSNASPPKQGRYQAAHTTTTKQKKQSASVSLSPIKGQPSRTNIPEVGAKAQGRASTRLDSTSKSKVLPGIEASSNTNTEAKQDNYSLQAQRKEDPTKRKKLFNTVMNKFNGLFDQWEGKLDELNHQMDTLKYYQNKYGRMRQDNKQRVAGGSVPFRKYNDNPNYGVSHSGRSMLGSSAENSHRAQASMAVAASGSHSFGNTSKNAIRSSPSATSRALTSSPREIS